MPWYARAAPTRPTTTMTPPPQEKSGSQQTTNSPPSPQVLHARNGALLQQDDQQHAMEASTPHSCPAVSCPGTTSPSRWTLAYSAGGCEFLFHGQRIPANPADREFAQAWLETATGLVAGRVMVVHPVRMGEGGFAGVVEERVRGCKLFF